MPAAATTAPGTGGTGGAQCIVTNDLLFGPLKPLTTEIEGAIGGIFLGIIGLIVVILAVLAVINVLRSKASTYIKAIVTVIAVPIGVIVLLIIYNAAILGLNNLC